MFTKSQTVVAPKSNKATKQQVQNPLLLDTQMALSTPFGLLLQRSLVAPRSLTRDDAARIQRSLGNQVIRQLGQFANGVHPLIQTELTPGSVGNANEQRVDHTSKQVAQRISSSRAPAHGMKQRVSQTIELQRPRHFIQRNGRTVDPDKVSGLDIQYEVIAHDMAYKDLGEVHTHDDQVCEELKKKPEKEKDEVDRYKHLLCRWGYLPGWAQKIDDSSTSFFVGLIMPDSTQKRKLNPILAFRGSLELYDFLISDTEPEGVGYDQFRNNLHKIGALIRFAGGQVDATGHSLGGALAQRAAIEFPSQIARIITFQSPGIARRDVNRLRSQRKRPKAMHHITHGDLVDFAGESNIPGTVYEHNVVTDSYWMGRGPVAHSDRLLNTPEYQSRRDKLGIADDLQPPSYNVGPTMQYGSYPHPNLRSVLVEPARTNARPIIAGVGGSAVSGGLPALAGGGGLAYLGTREYVFHDLAQNMNSNPAYAERLPLNIRIQAIRKFIVGPTTNTAENAILTILRASQRNGDLVQVIDQVSIWNIMKDTHGDEYTLLRNILRQHYYNQTSQDLVFAALRQCMDGATWEWEQEMIVDILTQRSDGRNLIERIGKAYRRGGFAEGWEEVMNQVDGEERARVRIAYGKFD